LLSRCTPVALLNGFDRLYPSFDRAKRAARGVRYGRKQRQALDIWVPTGPPAAEPLPVVIFIYGGGWDAGSRGDYGFAGAAYAGNGFVAIVPDYRLVPSVRFPAYVQDCALAVKWARDHVAAFGGDPGRITLAGHSAGAYNAAMVALDRHFLEDVGVDPAIVRAAALLAGPYDFYPFTAPLARAAMGRWPRPEETQPIHFARADAPPMFIATGSNDQMVGPKNSRSLAARLKALGATVRLKVYPGASHVDLATSLSRPFRRKTPVLAESVKFLKAHSKPLETRK
jgi:acetyl esterase/lipase